MSFLKVDATWIYSNPRLAQRRAKQLYNLKLYQSETKNHYTIWEKSKFWIYGDGRFYQAL